MTFKNVIKACRAAKAEVNRLLGVLYATPVEASGAPDQGFDVSQTIALCKRSLIAVAVFSGVANLLMLTPAFFMLNVYDKAMGSNSQSTLWMLSILAFFLFIVMGCMEVLRSRVLVFVSSRIDKALSPTIYRATMQSELRSGASSANGQALTDITQLRQFLTGPAVFAVFDAPWLPIYLAILFMFHPVFGWMGTVSAVVFFLLALINQRTAAPKLIEANRLAQANLASSSRALRNLEAVFAMGMQHELRRKWRLRQDEVLEAQESASNIAATFSGIIKTLRIAVQSLAIATGAYLALEQEISPGMIIAGSILIGRALQPVELAVSAWSSFIASREQFQRISELLRTTPKPQTRMQLPPMDGRVVVAGATIVPPGARQPTVRGITLNCLPETVTLIMGASGAGKSTFVRALLGLWPVIAGEIRIDGAAPADYDPDEFGSQVGYLPQDIELLDGTVSDNIARFKEFEPADVVLAAKDAGLHEFILSLPSAYDTVLGDGGVRLSPGQSQRVALARAIYKRPKLLVLDEPNSNLDQAGEGALSSAIETLKKKGSTILIISHRTGLLELSDHLVVMNNGVIADQGVPEEVLVRLQKARGHAIAKKTVKPGNASSGTVPVTIPKR
ncbi:MAG: type I secretion system permease/ATPase [Halioglobus sp.]|nr:type I secretion system permease/ATPase [Halioglobus sp.]